ncbi:MAG: MBL fold metallo-hydrolase [Caldimicrobium sp.]
MFEVLFLGTAGARYVVAKQLRASGGILLKFGQDYLLLDPGPGSIVYLAKNKIPVEKIKTLVVSHKHLDHSADLNILVDAITEGGFKKRGTLFITEEALSEGILLPYLRNCLQEIILLKEKRFYQSGAFKFYTTSPLKHEAEVYGLIFETSPLKKLGFIIDTAYFEDLAYEFRECSYLVINVVRFEPKEGVMHLSIPEVKLLLKKLNPEVAILTHFGMTMLRENPFKVAQMLSKELELKIWAAYDNMRIEL